MSDYLQGQTDSIEQILNMK